MLSERRCSRPAKYPPHFYRDWPGHSPKLIAAVDEWARIISPAWTPEKVRRRWVWRKAFELHPTLGRDPTFYRNIMPFSPLVDMTLPPELPAKIAAPAKTPR